MLNLIIELHCQGYTCVGHICGRLLHTPYAVLRTYAHILVTCYTSHFTFRAFYRQRQEGVRATKYATGS